MTPGAVTFTPVDPRPPSRSSSSARLPAGTGHLGGYDVLGELGRGGMGVVLRARDRATGREVAIKTLLRPQPDAQARFRREGEALAALDHPGIVKVHATGEAQGRPFMVCELVEGARPLDRAAAGLPLEARAALVRDACRALGHAHARGIVHRDVKAENLLVDAAGQVRVTDFGLATLESGERLTRTGAVVGTPFTMAPEQIAGARGAVGPATDVWALGVVLYQALTGALPFTSDSFAELCARICDARPTAPRVLSPETTRSLEAVCLRALSREPADRWADGDAMADALEAALRGERVAGRRRSLRPLLWLLAPAASLSLLGAALLYGPAPPAPSVPAPSSSAPAATRRPPTAPATPAADDARPSGAGSDDRSPPPIDLTVPIQDEPGHVRLFRLEAEAGRPGAMLALARIFREGETGVAPDPARSRAWLARAAATGDPQGMADYGSALLDGRYGARDVREGLRLLEAAAEAGNADGAVDYARALRRGDVGGDRAGNLERAIELLRRATATAQDLQFKRRARTALADALLDRARPDDVAEAMDLYELAIDEGSWSARLDLAQHLLDGSFGLRSPGRARELIQRVLDQGPSYTAGRAAGLLRRCDELEAGQGPGSTR